YRLQRQDSIDMSRKNLFLRRQDSIDMSRKNLSLRRQDSIAMRRKKQSPPAPWSCEKLLPARIEHTS
ncbi:MAG: hypothetical protein CMF59_13485, partial [Leptospiraceae bacterium]|nr:hypothetical protein [Leptospiraceae bacterium]